MTVNVDIDMTITEPSEIDMAVTQSADTVDFELGAEAIAVKNHAILENRDRADQHPISAITGLANILSTIPTKTSQLANDSGYVKATDIPTVPTKTSQLTNDSGFITSAQVPVQSVNGRTGAVTVTEGLAPLIGTTDDILPSQVSSAITEGRDVAISYTDGTFGELVFTAFNKAVTLNALVANTIAFDNSTLYLFELDGALAYNMWLFTYRELAQIEDLADYVPTTRTVNNKALSSDITLSASDVGALPSTTAIPTKTSDLTNDSGYVTHDNETEQSYISNPTSYSYWRGLMIGANSVVSESGTFSTTTDKVYVADSIRVQPSTGTIKATTFKGNLTGTASGNLIASDLVAITNAEIDSIVV